MELLTPDEILAPVGPNYSIIDRIDELRQQGLNVPQRAVDHKVREILERTKKGVKLETPNRELLFGIEYMEQLRAYRDNPIALASFVIVGDDPYYIAAWGYELPVANPNI